jgi:1,4-dihydroxy-2-naphthoate octaprenyltransferase
MRIPVFIKAVRAPFFTAAVIPVVLGSVAAWRDSGGWSWFRFVLTVTGAVCIHGAANLINDYFDHRWGADELNKTPTPFSGGSRVIQEGLMTPAQVLIYSLTLFGLGGGIGLYLNHLCGTNVILVIGIIGVGLCLVYTAGPFRLVYEGLGEIAVALGFGPLIVMGSYYVQAQALPLSAFLISIPIALLIALVLYINEFPDYLGDKAAGKKTLVVILGKKRAVAVYHAAVLLVYLIILALIACRVLPLTCLIVFVSVPLAYKAYAVSRQHYEKIFELLPANAATIGLHASIGLLMSAGIALNALIR